MDKKSYHTIKDALLSSEPAVNSSLDSANLNHNLIGRIFNCEITKLQTEENFNDAIEYLDSVSKETRPNDTLHLELVFENVDFLSGISIYSVKPFSVPLEFFDCCFESINLFDSTIDKKIRFRTCHFNETDFTNTKFKELADFWNCTFHKMVLFYKTDFLNTTVFSAATFEENVLFTYSLINKLILFRGTKFKKGLDLSLAIINGNIGVFDFRLGSFESEMIFAKENETKYENYVSKEGKIPIQNKRETYRIIKAQLETQKNISESLEYKILEKNTLFKEKLKWKAKLKEDSSFNRFSKAWKWFSDLWHNSLMKIRSATNTVLLAFNKISNNHGVGWVQGVFFTLFFGFWFFNLQLIATDNYDLTFIPNIPELPDYSLDSGQKVKQSYWQYYWSFIIPNHKFTYLKNVFGESYSYGKWFYTANIVGRIFVGYGIYQTIQAFRKFR